MQDRGGSNRRYGKGDTKSKTQVKETISGEAENSLVGSGVVSGSGVKRKNESKREEIQRKSRKTDRIRPKGKSGDMERSPRRVRSPDDPTRKK